MDRLAGYGRVETARARLDLARREHERHEREVALIDQRLRERRARLDALEEAARIIAPKDG